MYFPDILKLNEQLSIFFFRKGIIQPMRPGPDGKPRPVEHILELTEDIPDQPEED